MKFHHLAVAALIASEGATTAFVPSFSGRSHFFRKPTSIHDPTRNGLQMTEPEYNQDITSAGQAAAASAKRQQILKEIAESEKRRKELEREALRTMKEAEILKAQVAAGGSTAMETAQAATGAATFGALAIGRSTLQNRQKKLEEERTRIEGERARNEEQARENKNVFGVRTSCRVVPLVFNSLTMSCGFCRHCSRFSVEWPHWV